MLLRRLFHSTCKISLYHNNTLQSNQSLLSNLRKKTGYPIAHCKKALELSNNDLEKAESMLNIQAQAQGWVKAAKLQSRSTPNGLIGAVLRDNYAFMVELNCETDFVAKNEKFQSLVVQVLDICSRHSASAVSSSQYTQTIFKVGYSSEQLGNLQASENSTLNDLLAYNIGLIGENLMLRRGVMLYSSDNKIKFSCSAHPQINVDETLLGKYAALVAYQDNNSTEIENPELNEIIITDKLSKQLCQHIIGMNPRTINAPNQESSEDETVLLNQEFLAYPEFSVREVLSHVGWDIREFLRFECGESLDEPSS
nr:EOG090X0EI4 [Scapholeberis mucronata]